MRRSRWRPAAWATTSASTTRSGCTRHWPTGPQRQSIRRGQPTGHGSADTHGARCRPPTTLTYFRLPAVLTMGTTLNVGHDVLWRGTALSDSSIWHSWDPITDLPPDWQSL